MLNTGDSALYLAKQTGRGIYPAAPTYMVEVLEGGLTSKPTVARLNLRDGRLFGSSKKRTTFINTGGEVTLTAQPKAMGAIMAWMFGNDTPAGGGDPYTHVSIPPTSLAPGAWPYLTAWQEDLGRWSVFHDLQIVGGSIELGVDVGWARLKPTFIGMAVEQYLAVADIPSLAGAAEETDQVHWLDGSGYHCLNGDWTNMLHGAAPTTLATLKTWLHTVKDAFNAHCAVATGQHHKAADATNTLAYGDSPADLAACIVCLTELRADLILHEALTTTHYFADTTDNNPSSAWIEPCVTEADCFIAAQDFNGTANSPGCFNRHLGAVANLRKVLLTYDQKAEPWQGTGSTAYTVLRKPGDILIAVDQLQEDLRLLNLAKYGTPAPTTATEVTTEIQTLGFNAKYTASTTGAERSIKISVPQFDLDPTPLLELTGNTEGNEAVITLAGEATGTAPICTVTTLSSVATY